MSKRARAKEDVPEHLQDVVEVLRTIANRTGDTEGINSVAAELVTGHNDLHIDNVGESLVELVRAARDINDTLLKIRDALWERRE